MRFFLILIIFFSLSSYAFCNDFNINHFKDDFLDIINERIRYCMYQYRECREEGRSDTATWFKGGANEASIIRSQVLKLLNEYDKN